MLIVNPNGLIGDAIGTLPVVKALAEESTTPVQMVGLHPEIAAMMPLEYGIEIVDDDHADRSGEVVEINLTKAFAMGATRYYMTQAHFLALDLPVPTVPPRPKLKFSYAGVPEFEFAIAPFSRCLPDHELWPSEKWNEFVAQHPLDSFCLLGSSNDAHQNSKEFVQGDNVYPFFDYPLATVAHLLKRLRYGLISVVTGLSHMAFALDINNVQLESQGAWGVNPDGYRIHANGPVTDITIEQVNAKVQAMVARPKYEWVTDDSQ